MFLHCPRSQRLVSAGKGGSLLVLHMRRSVERGISPAAGQKSNVWTLRQGVTQAGTAPPSDCQIASFVWLLSGKLVPCWWSWLTKSRLVLVFSLEM